MATALARVAIAGFGQLSIRPQRALRIEAPEDAATDVLRVGIWFDSEEHIFGAQRRAEIRTIRIKVVKFSHYDLLPLGAHADRAPPRLLSCRLQNRAFD